jgi:hypothetical protein
VARFSWSGRDPLPASQAEKMPRSVNIRFLLRLVKFFPFGERGKTNRYVTYIHTNIHSKDSRHFDAIDIRTPRDNSDRNLDFVVVSNIQRLPLAGLRLATSFESPEIEKPFSHALKGSGHKCSKSLWSSVWCCKCKQGVADKDHPQSIDMVEHITCYRLNLNVLRVG